MNIDQAGLSLALGQFFAVGIILRVFTGVDMLTPVAQAATNLAGKTCATAVGVLGSVAGTFPKATIGATILGAGYFFRDELYNMTANTVQNTLSQPAALISNSSLLIPAAILGAFAAGYCCRRTSQVDSHVQRQIIADAAYARQIAALER